MNNTIYTIGYSGINIKDFILILKYYRISCLVDTRSVPYSKYFMDFDKNILESTLKNNNIKYENYDKEFGARQNNINFYSKDGYLDFSKFVKSSIFISGIDKIKKEMDLGYTFILMCSEKDPIDCHRSIMVAREFYKKGYNIINILYDKNNIIEYTQTDIENRLLDRYFSERGQGLLFDNMDLSRKSLIDIAYKKRNIEIGYRYNKNEYLYDRVQ